MKRICVSILAVMILLTGCAPARVYETVSDVPPIQLTQPAQVTMQLPSDAAVATIYNGEGDRIYICDRFTVAVQTLSGGDLDSTLRTVTGFSRDALTVLQTGQQPLRYECAFSCAGEKLQVGRAVIYDDGVYHYAVSVLADADIADTVQWEQVLESVQLSTAP